MRRWFFLLWLAMLLAPASGLFSAPERISEREARMLAQPPSLPQSSAGWLDLPSQLDAFIRDQFAFRAQMVRASALVREALNDEAAENGTVMTGRNGFLLLREGLAQSLGYSVSPERATRDAPLICAMQRRFAREGVRFVYAIAPAPTTIYPEAAPISMGQPQSPTNYDLLLQAARGCGADVIDLRPALRAGRSAHLLYRRDDTHWTPRGALIAFNTIMDHMGHSELGIDPNAVLWRDETKLGDLTRMFSASAAEQGLVSTPDLAPLGATRRIKTPLPEPNPQLSGFIYDYPREGLSVLLIGDSYTHAFFPQLLAPHVRRLTFLHHQRCGFDWNNVERAQADIVLFMPTERFAFCDEGAHPLHFSP